MLIIITTSVQRLRLLYLYSLMLYFISNYPDLVKNYFGLYTLSVRGTGEERTGYAPDQDDTSIDVSLTRSYS